MATIEATAQGAHHGAVVSPRPVVIVGGGEHARVVADAVRSRPDIWTLAGYTDPAGPNPAMDPTVEHLGDDADLRSRWASAAPDDRPALILGIGADPAARHRAITAFGDDAAWASIVHSAAWVSPSALVAAGAVVLAGAVVNAGARIGRHAIVNTHAVIEHDVHVGERTHVAPAAAIGGGTRIGDDVVVGLGAAVRDHIVIGDGAVVGMGAVVVADVAAGQAVMGVPARVRETTGG
jgi:sugar O-acyltransferase (sialic acid O-acetyltransferase NeuD family)